MVVRADIIFNRIITNIIYTMLSIFEIGSDLKGKGALK